MNDIKVGSLSFVFVSLDSLDTVKYILLRSMKKITVAIFERVTIC